MNGLFLISGVVCATISVAFLIGGIVMFLLLWLPPELLNDRSEKAVNAFIIAGGCSYLGVAALLGFWVPAECWIMVGAVAVQICFLIAVSFFFPFGEEEQV
jgi:hypothetical protein